MLSEIILPQKDKHYIWFSLYEVSAAVLYLVDLSCPTLCNTMDCSHQAPLSMGTLQATGVVAMPSRGSSKRRDETQISHIAGRFFTIWET